LSTPTPGKPSEPTDKTGTRSERRRGDHPYSPQAKTAQPVGSSQGLDRERRPPNPAARHGPARPVARSQLCSPYPPTRVTRLPCMARAARLRAARGLRLRMGSRTGMPLPGQSGTMILTDLPTASPARRATAERPAWHRSRCRNGRFAEDAPGRRGPTP
jgi:hypothetical protein